MEAVECITVMKVGPRSTEGLILYSNSKKPVLSLFLDHNQSGRQNMMLRKCVMEDTFSIVYSTLLKLIFHAIVNSICNDNRLKF